MDPLLSVILPVYNCERFVEECIESILGQTFSDFELLIYNDGSTDNSLEKIGKFNDPRIILFNSETNKGYVCHLNNGIKEAKGKYLVRMDADDVCYSNRFLELVKFMEANPEIGVCGSYVKVFGNVKEYVWKLNADNNSIKASLPFRIPFIHPSVIIRKKVLNEQNIAYKQEFLPAEDYEIWCDLYSVTNFANSPKVLLKYRQHQGQISKEKKAIQQNKADDVRKKYFRNLFINDEDFTFYQSIVNEKIECTLDFMERTVSLFHKMKTVNDEVKLFDPLTFHNELCFQTFKVATHISSHKIKTIKTFKRSGFYKPSVISKYLFIKYRLKNI